MKKLSAIGRIAEQWLLNHDGNIIELIWKFQCEMQWDKKTANHAFYDVWENSDLVTW